MENKMFDFETIYQNVFREQHRNQAKVTKFIS